jgi:ABC-type spermidine/putrescine transport system permease subunit I
MCGDGLGAGGSHSRASGGQDRDEVELEFSPWRCGSGARVSGKNLMFSRAYKTAVTAPPLVWVTVFLLRAVSPDVLLQLLVGLPVADDRALVESSTTMELASKVNVYWQTLLRSMWIAARVTFFSLLLGYPLAYFLSFYAGKKKDLLYQLVIIPLWVSYLVRAYAWKTILGSDGVLNTLLQYVHLTKHPLEFLLYSPFAVVLDAHSHLHAVCVSADLCGAGTYSPQPGGGLARSGRDSGANLLESDFPAVDSWRGCGSDVRLRLQPGRFSGAAVAGRPERHHDFQHRGQPVRRGLQLAAGRGDFTSACCCWSSACCFSPSAWKRNGASRERHETLQKNHRLALAARSRRGGVRVPLSADCGPHLYSFNGEGVGGFPPHHLTLDWYRTCLPTAPIWDSVLNSLQVAFAAMAIALTFGMPAALSALGPRAVSRQSAVPAIGALAA